jgi:streptogramin lyase
VRDTRLTSKKSIFSDLFLSAQNEIKGEQGKTLSLDPSSSAWLSVHCVPSGKTLQGICRIANCSTSQTRREKQTLPNLDEIRRFYYFGLHRI